MNLLLTDLILDGKLAYLSHVKRESIDLAAYCGWGRALALRQDRLGAD